MVKKMISPNSRVVAAILVLISVIILSNGGCGSGPESPSGLDTNKKFKDTIATPGPVSTGMTETPVISPAGYMLDEAEFDLLQTMPNPLTNEQWDTIFGSHSGGSADRTGNAEPQSWYYSSPTSQCSFEVTVAVTFRRNESHPFEQSDDGTYAYSRWASGASHIARSLAPKDQAEIDCFFGPWDKETSIAGATIIEYRVSWRRIAGTCDFDAPITAEYEAYYKSRTFSRAVYWEICPGVVRVANSFAVDRAQAVGNGKTLFASSAGTQAGDDILPSISWEMGGGPGVTSPVTIASGDTVNKEEGTVDNPEQGKGEAFINGFGKDSSTGFTGYVLISSGCKVHAEQDSRTRAAATVYNRSMGLYGVVSVAGGASSFYTWAGEDAAQVSKDIGDLMRPFFDLRGFPNTPPE